MNFKFYLTFFILFFSVLNFTSCKTIPISDLSQDDGITRIKKSYEKKEWADVITDVDEYKTRYPYSKFIQEADLMQADSYYQSNHYPEAISAYEDFIRKNPTNSNTALAYYRIGKAYDFQAPDNIDRDQGNAHKALDKFNYFIQNFHTAEWMEDAKQRKEILTRRIADYNSFVAEFYWKKDLYAAALTRYLVILNTYSEYDDLTKTAKLRAHKCYLELAKMLEEKPDSDEYVYFKDETPDSLRKKAEEFKQLSNN